MEKDSIVVVHKQLDVAQTQSYSSESFRLWLEFIRDRRWSRRQKHQLLKVFGDPKNIYQTSRVDRAKVMTGRVREGLVNGSLDYEKRVQQDLCWMENSQAHFITFDSPFYPYQLRQIADPPLALFALGDLPLLKEPQVAIVGSRRPTPIGSKLARQFAQELSNLGLVITSGMALGVDGLSHEGALDQDNPTVAVMGCGLDSIYPARHRGLFEQIKKHGLLVSEYPPCVKASKYTFPERNRIVSGLSLGVVIVEAAIKSGTMITARLAVEQNRELMVLPGSALSSQYEGSHSLLRDGAALVSSTEDILFVLKDPLKRFGIEHQKKGLARDEGENNDVSPCQSLLISEEAVDGVHAKVNVGVGLDPLLELIGAESVSVETLIINSGLTPAEVSSMLLMLELEGRVAISDDGGYINIS